MDELRKRLKSDPHSQAGRLLAEASRVVEWSPTERQRFISGLSSAARGGRPRPSLVAWSVGAFATGLLIALLLPFTKSAPEGWQRVEGLAVGEVEVDPFAAVRVPPNAAQPFGERQMFLDSGQLRARVDPQPANRPFVVITPQLRVIVVGTRFFVGVEPASSEVAVEEGIVRVEARSGRSLLLKAGERATSDDARLMSQDDSIAPIASSANSATQAPARTQITGPVAEAIQPFESCLAAEGSARRRCLMAHVGDDGLSGQNAMYLLGQLEAQAGNHEKAIEYWSMYTRRFPDGAMAPEVSRKLLDENLTLGKSREALDAADDFLKRFPADTRKAETTIIRGRLLCSLGEVDQAVRTFEALASATSAPGPKDLALYELAHCLVSVGDKRRGLQALERYLAEVPGGRFTSEVRTLMKHDGVSND